MFISQEESEPYLSMPISTRGAGAAAPMVMDRESGGAAMELEAEPPVCEPVDHAEKIEDGQ